MYEDYLQNALGNLITSRSELYRYSEQPNSKLYKTHKSISSYHVQQSLELLLKYLIYNNTNYNKYSNNIKQLFTHDLDLLIRKYCIPYNIKVPKTIIKNAPIYTKWEAESRYSFHFSVRKDSILKAINETEGWLIQIRPQYKPIIHKYRTKYHLEN